MQSKAQKFIIGLYRTVSIVVLTGLIGAVIWFLSLVVFYLLNSSWAAPTILSPTSDRMLQFSAGYQQATQNYTTLNVVEAQAERDVQFAHDNVQKLRNLGGSFIKYNNLVDRLGSRKSKELMDSYALLTKLEKIKQITQESLKIGLITNEDAVQTISAIQQFHNGTTDGSLALNSLRINTESQAVLLAQQVAQAENDVYTKQDMLTASKISLRTATNELKTLNDSAYYGAINRGANLAFVPYATLKHTRVGSPVYDCYLHNFLCRKIGQVIRINKDEMVIPHPLFKVETRGVLVEVQLTNRDSMYSKILFIGSKPLFL